MKKKFNIFVSSILLLIFTFVGTSSVFAKPTVKECRDERQSCLRDNNSDVGETLCWVEYVYCIYEVYYGD